MTNLWWKVGKIWQSSSFILHLFRNGGSSLQWFALAPSMGLHTQSGLAHWRAPCSHSRFAHWKRSGIYTTEIIFLKSGMFCAVCAQQMLCFLACCVLAPFQLPVLAWNFSGLFFLKVCLTCYSVKHWLLEWVVLNRLYFQLSPLREVVNFEHVGKRMLLLKVLWSPIEQI